MSDVAPEVTQLEREKVSLERARELFRATSKAAAVGNSPAGATLIRRALPALENSIRSEQERIREGAKPDQWQRFILLESDTLALITLKTILGALAEADEYSEKITMLARRIGEWCEAECQLGMADVGERRLVEAFLRRNSRRSNALSRAKKMLAQLEGPAEPRETIKLGASLLRLALSPPSLFEVLPGRVKEANRIGLSRGSREGLVELLGVMEGAIEPRHSPMVVRPRPWTDLRSGGYLSARLPFVKREHDVVITDALNSSDLTHAFGAVNALQETRWRINKRVLDLYHSVYSRTGSLDLGRVVCPTERDAPGKADSHCAPFSRTKPSVSARLRLDLCNDLARHECIYFPHQLDHRGRAYPVPPWVNPQADDIGRAPLEFQEGLPLGARGAHWLAINLASLSGRENLSMGDRASWTKAHSDEIVEIAKNPLHAYSIWNEVEPKKRWRFLRAAFDWAGYVDLGPELISHLPLSMDGTCNGMQHLSALGRDAEGGQATNLCQDDRRWDVYAEVAAQLAASIGLRARQGEKEATSILPYIDRDLVKQTTMTTPYGLSSHGLRSQIADKLEERLSVHKRQAFALAKYLESSINLAISRVVSKATEIMKWLQEVAELGAENGRGLWWNLPTGLRIAQHYLKESKRRVKTAAWTLEIRDQAGVPRLDKKKQRDSIVANLVHSLDAAHMMRTVLLLKERGIEAFAMVHDGYGVHPGNVDAMNRTLREAFVELHEAFTLSSLAAQFRQQLPDVVMPPPPRPGGLHIRSVLESVYFFS